MRGNTITTLLRTLAIVLGVGCALGETIRTWGSHRPALAVIDDFLICAFLLAAAARARRRGGLALRCAAFAFAAGILYSSLALHLAALAEPDPGNIAQHWLTALIGLAFVGSVGGLGLSIFQSTREAAVRLSLVTLLVRDYDEAKRYFVDILGFELLDDRPIGAEKRWLVVAPHAAAECKLLLARATTPEQQARIGAQTGGRVGFFLHTDDFERDHALLRSRGVRFCEAPRNESYGQVVVFEDLYGNRWDLIGPA